MKKTNLRTYYINLMRDAKRLSALSKNPTISRKKSWDISQEAFNKEQLAKFYENFLSVKEGGDKMLDVPQWTNLYVQKLIQYLKEEKAVYAEIQESPLLSQKDKDSLINMLKNVGLVSHYNALSILDEEIMRYKPQVLVDGILQLDCTASSANKKLILHLMDRYKCNKVCFKGASKVKTRKEIEK